MGITGIWTMSNFNDSIHQFLRYLRISIIPLVFYIIESPEISIKIIKFWIITQFFVILNSYALWLGFSVPWVINEHSMRDLTPFTSTLEQPIMNTLMFVVTWYFRKDIAKSWGKPTVYLILILCLFEIFFIMMGRTGFLSMIIALSLITFWSLNRKMRFIALIMPFLLFIGLNYSSPVFKTKFQEVIQDVKDYKSGRTDTSQGNRIDFTARSLQAIELRPILGYGVGSWPIAYKIALNGEKGKEGADNPHEQYLLWFVEGGIVAFFMLIIIYMSVVIDALRLPKKTQKSLLTIIIILALIGLLNCPLHGAGMSEYFCLLIALLLRNPESATKA
jgi:O-antigen ligase